MSCPAVVVHDALAFSVGHVLEDVHNDLGEHHEPESLSIDEEVDVRILTQELKNLRNDCDVPVNDADPPVNSISDEPVVSAVHCAF